MLQSTKLLPAMARTVPFGDWHYFTVGNMITELVEHSVCVDWTDKLQHEGEGK